MKTDEIHHPKTQVRSVRPPVGAKEKGHSAMSLLRERALGRRSPPISYRGALLARDGTVCYLCGRQLGVLPVFDHVLPKCEGGKTVLSNMRLVHDICNRRKGRKLIPCVTPEPLPLILSAFAPFVPNCWDRPGQTRMIFACCGHATLECGQHSFNCKWPDSSISRHRAALGIAPSETVAVQGAS